MNKLDRYGAADLPIIGITAGDPAGIGPEVVLKSVCDDEIGRHCRPVVIGDRDNLEWTARKLGIPLNFRDFDQEQPAVAGTVDLVGLSELSVPVTFGSETSETGRSAAKNIEKAVALWRDGSVDAIATAPISKNALRLGGYEFPGHTEFLAALTETSEFAMSFFAGKLRVALLSTHLSLRDAIERVRTAALSELIEFCDRELPRFVGKRPRIAIAGLNPHASEGGMFGTEEAAEIEPSIAECRRKGIDVSGPYSPDTIFLRGFRGEFDLVVACYHDQATIAVKCLSFGSSVNVTLGLPLIRTSVDHGTAFDIAGQGIADASSMKAAILLAADLCSGASLV